MALLINILLVIYVVVALLMVLVILMQRPKSEGLGAAFGGGVTENIFGAQTTNVLTKITSWLATFFFLLTFGLSILYAHKGSTKSELHRELMRDQPAAEATPGASPSGTAGQPSAVANATPAPTVSAESTGAEIKPTRSPVASIASPAGSMRAAGSPEAPATPSDAVKGTPRK